MPNFPSLGGATSSPGLLLLPNFLIGAKVFLVEDEDETPGGRRELPPPPPRGGKFPRELDGDPSLGRSPRLEAPAAADVVAALERPPVGGCFEGLAAVAADDDADAAAAGPAGLLLLLLPSCVGVLVKVVEGEAAAEETSRAVEALGEGLLFLQELIKVKFMLISTSLMLYFLSMALTR